MTIRLSEADNLDIFKSMLFELVKEDVDTPERWMRFQRNVWMGRLVYGRTYEEIRSLNNCLEGFSGNMGGSEEFIEGVTGKNREIEFGCCPLMLFFPYVKTVVVEVTNDDNEVKVRYFKMNANRTVGDVLKKVRVLKNVMMSRDDIVAHINNRVLTVRFDFGHF